MEVSRLTGRPDSRFYRVYEDAGQPGFAFRVTVETTDLYIRAARKLSAEALTEAKRARQTVQDHIANYPEFATSLTALREPEGELEAMIRSMYRAGQMAGTGPMAAVAGTVAEQVGRALRALTPWVMVENGGDIYFDVSGLYVTRPTVIGLYAGQSPFSGKIGLRLDTSGPMGVCTSSGTVGPSLSYGKADAATVLSTDTALADAVATELGNRIKSPDDLELAVGWAAEIDGIDGALAILGDKLACRGAVTLEKLG